MSKKITAMLLVLCLVLSLAACSSGGSNEQSSQSQESSQTQEPSQSAEPSTAEESSEPEKESSEPEETETTSSEESDSSSEDTSQTPKSGHDEISEEELANLKESIAKSIVKNYFEPNNIDPASFAWPDKMDDVWGYYDIRMNDFQGDLVDGETEARPADTEDSYYSELGEAIFLGVIDWLDSQGPYKPSYLNRVADVLRPYEDVILSIDLTSVSTN